MAVTFKQLVKFTSTASASTSTFTTTADILPDEDIFIAIGRAVGSVLCGVSGVSVSAGAGTFERVDTSCRANTLDVHLARFRCTTLIPSGSVVTITHRSSTAKRGGIMQVVSGLTSAAANADGGNLADNQLGSTSRGSNGSSTNISASTDAATSVANCLVLCAVGEGGTNAFSEASGTTKIDEARTTSGSGDRGVGLFYKIVSATGVQTANASASPSAGWAAAIGAFEIAAEASTVQKANFFPHL
jgi:hypothetical protein